MFSFHVTQLFHVLISRNSIISCSHFMYRNFRTISRGLYVVYGPGKVSCGLYKGRLICRRLKNKTGKDRFHAGPENNAWILPIAALKLHGSIDGNCRRCPRPLPWCPLKMSLSTATTCRAFFLHCRPSCPFSARTTHIPVSKGWE